MIQRIQSLYLSSLCMAMIAFLSFPIWEKVELATVCTIKSFALIVLKGQYIMVPYGLSALLACYITIVASYTIIRHDNRKLQLRLVRQISLLLVLLLLFVLAMVSKTNSAYLLNGYSCYKIGIIFPFISLVVNLLAGYHIKKDEQLVNQDQLR